MSYLVPYIFRVAITNRRLVSLADDPTGGPPTVTFRYRPSGTRQWQLCTVTVMEFIRRFLQHVLPKGFVKVRYYGFFSPGQRPRLRQIAAWLRPSVAPGLTSVKHEVTTTTVTLPETARLCSLCGQPLRRLQTLLPQRSQPTIRLHWQPP